jgi:hypothetical protein
MKKCLLVSLAVMALAAGLAAQTNKHVHMTRTVQQTPQLPPAGLNITYNGGPIMNGNNSVYVVFYGTWSRNARTIIENFLENLGSSPLYAINSLYFDDNNKHIKAGFAFNKTTNEFNDDYSLGKALQDADVQTIVSNAIAGGHLPNDTNGIYFVLTATDVSESFDGLTFCGFFCGYHGPSTSIVTGETLKYSFVGNSARCPTACDGNVAVFGDKTSPNNDVGGDGTVSIMFHELSETVTDPEVNMDNAWTGNFGENGDICNFNFGKTFIAGNGTHANQKLGGRPYLLQQMFKLTGQTPPVVPGVCAQFK